MQTNSLMAFFKELVQRFGQKSPLLFKIISWISAVATALTGLPGFLTMFNIVLPEPWNALSNKTVAIAGLVGFFISNLTVSQATSVAANTANDLLPFTAAHPVDNKNAKPVIQQPVPPLAK